MTDDVRIHGIITHGGDAPNIVPDFASARFYLRAATRPVLDDVFRKVEKIVEGAGLATGATGKIIRFQNKVDNLVQTPLFDRVYQKNLEVYGENITIRTDDSPKGSSDVGNVSQVIPTIQPTITISEIPIDGHSIEFVEAAKSKKGLESIGLGAKVLAATAFDLYTDKDLLEKIKIQHQQNIENQ